MNAMQMSSMLTTLKASPATITGLIQDYRKLDTGDSVARGAFILKIYKLVEPVIEVLKELPGGAKIATSVLLAYNDFINIQTKWEANEVTAADYFSLTASSADTISNILYMVPGPQAKAAGLAFQVIAGVASYGAVMAQREGGDAIDPKLSNEREQIIRNHIPVKTDKQDGIEEYYLQAQKFLAKEPGWSLSMDLEIARAMIKQGYDQKTIMDAIQSISPCAAGTTAEEAKFYGNYIIDRENKRVNGSLNEEVTTEKNNVAKIEEIRKTSLSIEDLPRNPHSKVLFDAYARELLGKDGQVWTPEMNKIIAENMLKDGVTPQRVEQALKHSPEFVEKAYYFVKDIKNSPELQVAQQSKGRGIC